MAEYLNLAYLKNSLSILHNKKNSKLSEIIIDSNDEINKVVEPFVNEIPILPGSDLFRTCTLLSTMYAQSRWFRDTGQLERSESSKEEYDSKKDAFLEMLLSRKSTKTRAVFITAPNPLRRIYTPFSTDEYLVREFD